ncbi:MAG: 5'-nucleotidase C-terminal domain-containing protein [Syntrophorhabdaceae bacterium]|nr:5'-nucleotidase C-terminal domain-containing protein [Syntrophorhabdaceae bacterium]
MKKRILIFLSIIFIIFFVSFNALCEDIDIRVLYVNDFHGFAEEQKSDFTGGMVGGATYIGGMVDRLRQERPSLLLSAGDMIQGSNWANLFYGKSVIEIMNIMGFDAMTIGNHEFDFGIDALKERMKDARFPFLGANIIGIEGIQPFIVRQLKDIKIAIIGLATEETPIYTHPDNVRGLVFQSAFDTAEIFIKELRDKVDMIIILSHLGLHNDMVLAQKIGGIDVIVGGHSHTKIEKPVLIGKTIIVQAWEHGKVLGVLDLTLRDGEIKDYKGYLIDIKPSARIKNKEVEEVVKKYQRKIRGIVKQKIGETEVDLDGVNSVRRETNFGNLVSDAIKQRTQSDIVIINGGSIKMGIGRGPITMGQIYNALPFNNYIVAIKMKGKDIIEALRHGTSTRENNSGRFPQVSGIRFSFSRDRPGESTIREVAFRGEPIELEKEYNVATTDFLMAGGDGYRVFGGYINSHIILHKEPGKWVRDLVVEYIKTRKKVNPVVEGRITEIK